MTHPPAPPSVKIGILFLLYMSQGLPFGFQSIALPVYLRTCGVSLTAIGFTGALALPWMLKFLWSPLVDRFGSPSIGMRKSWILPLQLLMVAVIITASAFDPATEMTYLLISVFAVNLIAATQDIAVDGLAIDMLGPRELGPGNAAQVVGYKAGMLISGGLLVWLSAWTGWRGLFLIMGTLAFLPVLPLLFYREGRHAAAGAGGQSLGIILSKVRAAFALPGAWWLMAFIATYKTGEVMIDAMFKPFLVDSGFSAAQIGLWLGTYGMAASLAGSLFGGYCSSRLSVFRGLAIAALLRIIPLALEWRLTLLHPGAAQVIGVTLAEHFFGGMLTTAMFAYMMSRVNREIGATHYTILACVEVLGKSPGAWASGLLAERMGYSSLFAAGVLISLVTLALLAKAIPRPAGASL